MPARKSGATLLDMVANDPATASLSGRGGSPTGSVRSVSDVVRALRAIMSGTSLWRYLDSTGIPVPGAVNYVIARLSMMKHEPNATATR